MIRGARPPTAADDRIRELITIEGRLEDSAGKLLEELRDAASSLPRRREDIAVEEGGWK